MKYALLALGLLTVMPATAGAWENAFGIRPAQSEKSLKIIREPSSSLYEIKVPKPHKEFTKYEAVATATTGVCKLIASGGDRRDDQTGTASRAAFREIEASLQQKFGKPLHADVLNDGSDAPEDWSKSFFMDGRSFLSYWDAERGAELPKGVIAILLKVSVHHIHEDGEMTHAPYIHLEYEFDNIERCIEKLS